MSREIVNKVDKLRRSLARAGVMTLGEGAPSVERRWAR